MDIFDLLKNRYSCRQFSHEKPSDAQLESILEAVRLAPSSRNGQPTRVYVIDQEESLEKIKRTRKYYFGEPCVLLFTYDKNESWKRNLDNYDSGTFDVAIVVTQVCLAAKAIGLDTCMIMTFDPKALRRQFDIPEQEEIICEVALGYAAEDTVPSSHHDSRKPQPIVRL